MHIMSMIVRTDHVPTLTTFLSAERLNALISQPRPTELAIELHQDALRLGSALMFLIATIEVSLRNTIWNHLAEHFSATNWLIRTPPSFSWKEPEAAKIREATAHARRAELERPAGREQAERAAAAQLGDVRAEMTRRQWDEQIRQHVVLSEGMVICGLTLFFWKRLCSQDYEHSLWKPVLKRTFPDRGVERAQVAFLLERIYQTRNRLAHHEPVLHKRFAETMGAIDFVVTRLSEPGQNPDAPLACLLRSDIAIVREMEARFNRRLLDPRAV